MAEYYHFTEFSAWTRRSSREFKIPILISHECNSERELLECLYDSDRACAAIYRQILPVRHLHNETVLLNHPLFSSPYKIRARVQEDGLRRSIKRRFTQL